LSQLQGHRVDAVAVAAPGTVAEDVTKMTAAGSARDLGATHEQAAVLVQLDVLSTTGSVKLGHPVPESNLASEENSSVSQAAQR
jgi:hypothetical protein